MQVVSQPICESSGNKPAQCQGVMLLTYWPCVSAQHSYKSASNFFAVYRIQVIVEFVVLTVIVHSFPFEEFDEQRI